MQQPAVQEWHQAGLLSKVYVHIGKQSKYPHKLLNCTECPRDVNNHREIQVKYHFLLKPKPGTTRRLPLSMQTDLVRTHQPGEDTPQGPNAWKEMETLGSKTEA